MLRELYGHQRDPVRVAVVGAGWAGLAAAVAATQAGMRVSLYEAAREPGGRARNVAVRAKTPPATAAISGVTPDTWTLDNGQHILIGAYRASLALMRTVGVSVEHALLRLPLDLRDAHGCGLALPQWPAALQAAAGVWGIATAKGWSWPARWALLRKAAQWQRQHFAAQEGMTVAQLCAGLPAELVQQFIEPLCIAGLNTPIDQASAQVFLRVLQDSLAGGPGSADMLLPTQPLGDVLAKPAVQWLQRQGTHVFLGQRVERLRRLLRSGTSQAAPGCGQWQLDDAVFDAVVIACPAWEATRLLADCAEDALRVRAGERARVDLASLDNVAGSATHWLHLARQLRYEAIATVYLQADVGSHGTADLPRPMLAVHDGPAQFVFDRHQLAGQRGLTAWVASTLQEGKEALTQAVLQQSQRLQQALPLFSGGADEKPKAWLPIATVVEKRATFRCSAGLVRPPMRMHADWPTLVACGDYIDGPYPATLEGAVLSGQNAVAALRATLGAGR
ncbi:desaturase [Lampropedia puyangensis]|uniref:Desaturase n=1 Tax=Lampropedia puyangensis TaxID=1330072 RepID=A0A4S8F2C4_9BURK|nr:hydroxysqualene dehydroxylase HpnE [Lampropedia puyangensis]THU01468.1 desaturase [Lampropedia puyangensis]